MGLIIVTIVGAILGWLVAIVVERDDRAGSSACALIGAAGATVCALLAGNVPLFSGVSPSQLLWAAAGAIASLALLNFAYSLWTRAHHSQSLPTRRASGTPAPIRR